jgi:hypothetical protein
VKHCEDTTYDTLSSHRRRTIAPLDLATPLLHSRDDLDEHAATMLKSFRPGPEHIHDHQTTSSTLVLEEPQQSDEPRAHLLNPARGPPVGRKDNSRDTSDRLLERRENTLLAICEQLIECAPRYTRASDYMSDAHASRTVLADNLDQTGENPRTLNISHTLATNTLGDNQHPINPPGPATSNPTLRQTRA